MLAHWRVRRAVDKQQIAQLILLLFCKASQAPAAAPNTSQLKQVLPQQVHRMTARQGVVGVLTMATACTCTMYI
jgi:hypothetical protein